MKVFLLSFRNLEDTIAHNSEQSWYRRRLCPKKEGEVIISGSGFIPGDAIWIKIAMADKDEQDVDLTKDLVNINDQSAFTITVNCEDPPRALQSRRREFL